MSGQYKHTGQGQFARDSGVLANVVYALLQVEIGFLSLVAAWEAQVYALQTIGIDLFASAKQVCFQIPLHSCNDTECGCTCTQRC